MSLAPEYNLGRYLKWEITEFSPEKHKHYLETSEVKIYGYNVRQILQMIYFCQQHNWKPN